MRKKLSLLGSGRVVAKSYYTDPRTLYVTRPDPRTKSVHVEIERTSLRPDKVRIAYLSETRAD